MEFKVQLPHSQELATFPYLTQINPDHAPSRFLKIHFNIIQC
jgi:hypothetical protein